MKLFNGIKTSRVWMLTALIILIVVIGIVWFSLQFTGKNRTISGVQIQIQPDSGLYFLTQQDISGIITKSVGNPIGKSVSQLNLSKLEASIRRLPFTEKVQVFASLDGKLKISVTQRTPVIRIQNTHAETYYLDSSGVKIPYKLPMNNGAIDILSANGNITEKFSDSNKIHSPVLKELLRIAVYIKNNPVWDAQFEQCYVDNFGDIILVPRIGRHSIVLGSSENLPLKLENLRVFYDQGLRNLGWETYSVINLKYRDQVVATRNGKQIEHKIKENVQNPEH